MKAFKEYLTENESDDIKLLKQKLDKHDWYYMMSDDSRHYNSGEKEEKEIYDLIKKIGKSGEDLYVQYYKKNFPNSKYTPQIIKNEDAQRFLTFAEVRNMR